MNSQFTFHPAKEQPIKAAVLTFVLGIALQALWQMLSPMVAVVLWLVLVGSLRDFFLETQYHLSSEGLSICGPLKPSRHYPWERFRAYVEDRNGLFLTPYSKPRASEGPRGVFLPMQAEQRRQAVALCEQLELSRRQR